uniref:ABC transporter domain-containing protein n=1 Tax=Trichobilharzia regenti TaxID=157069 RepID=A0AA85KEU3_TRIRE|nr:unnamed protein product [Trichobilharzia regenti]
MKSNHPIDISLVNQTHIIRERSDLNALHVNIPHTPDFHATVDVDYPESRGVFDLECLKTENTITASDKSNVIHQIMEDSNNGMPCLLRSHSFNPYDYPVEHYYYDRTTDDHNRINNDQGTDNLECTTSHPTGSLKPPHLPPRRNQRSIDLLIYTVPRSPSDTCLISRKHHNLSKSVVNSGSPQPYDSSQVTSPDDTQLSMSLPPQPSNISKYADTDNLQSFSTLHTSLPVTNDKSFQVLQALNNVIDNNRVYTDGHMRFRSMHGGAEDPKFPYTRMNSKTSVDDVSPDCVQPVDIQKIHNEIIAKDSKRKTVINPGGSPSAPTSSFSQRGKISGATLSFHHISYEVKLRKATCSKPVIKTVLNDISGILRPGMNALMGPTGGGKSSLLDVLAGRKDPKFLTGRVLIDGRPQPKNFKCISGYVVQDDIVMGTLTVRENLSFSAALRMTVRCTTDERNQKVNEIIDELGLNSVADSKVGTELVRGVSGGERKRTSIGMELITEPPVLFLDEPTTGLDAYMAGQVLKTLKALSRRGRTIIFSIHQPKYSIYKLFDSLTLIYRGQLIYHGPAKKEPIRYFGHLGYICENHNNPPDFFMDVIHGECLRQQGSALVSTEITSLNGDIVDHHDTQEKMHLVGQQLINEWQNSEMAQRVLEEVSSIANRLEEHENGTNKFKDRSVDISFAAPYFRQVHKVCWRTTLNLLRDPLASVIQTIVYLFFALSMGIVYFQMNDSLESGIQNRTGLFFFCTLQVIFVNLATIELFIKERALFIHESSSGYYQVSVYFFSKILCDILPTKVLPIILFMPICYWMAGLQRTFQAFMFFELILCLTTLAAAAIALFISASVTVFGLANAILSIMYVFMMAFSGYLINLKSMAVWLSWLRYFSLFRYSMGGLLAMEMTPLRFCPMDTSNTTIQRQCQNGTTYLEDQEIPYKTTWDLWYNVFGQVVIMIIFYILCYIQLRLLNKYK